MVFGSFSRNDIRSAVDGSLGGPVKIDYRNIGYARTELIKQIHVGGFGGDNEIAQVRKTDFPKIRTRQPKYRRGYCRKRKAMAFHDIQYVQVFHSLLWNSIDTRSKGERIKKRHHGDIECQFEHL